LSKQGKSEAAGYKNGVKVLGGCEVYGCHGQPVTGCFTYGQPERETEEADVHDPRSSMWQTGGKGKGNRL
jgi:hypothetical protein